MSTTEIDEQKYLRNCALRQTAINQLEVIEKTADDAKNDSSLHNKFKVSCRKLKKIIKDYEKYHNAVISLIASSSSRLTQENEKLTDFTERCSEIETLYYNLFESDVTDPILNQTTFQPCNSDHSILPKINLPTFTGETQNF